jgi:hypothetical protein
MDCDRSDLDMLGELSQGLERAFVQSFVKVTNDKEGASGSCNTPELPQLFGHWGFIFLLTCPVRGGHLANQ